MLELLPDLDEEDCEDTDCLELVQLEDGDHIFTIGLLPPAEEIRAGSAISQCLAKAFKLNSKASAPLGCAIPDYLKEFEDVFSKESFDNLPELKQWDHAIEFTYTWGEGNQLQGIPPLPKGAKGTRQIP